MKRSLCIALIFSLSLAVFGCYDNTEIDSIASVVAVGSEIADSDTVKYTFAIADTSGFTSDGDGGAKSGLICVNAFAQNIADAIKEINGKISKKLNFSHMSIILFSEDLSLRDVKSELEYLENNFEAGPQTLLAVSEFEPSEYLEKFSPAMEVNAEKYFNGIFQSKNSNNPSLTLAECTNAIKCNKKIKIPIIHCDSDGNNIAEEQAYISGVRIMDFQKFGG